MRYAFHCYLNGFIYSREIVSREKTTRTYVRELVNDGSVLIGSSQKGYFKIKSRKEAKQAIEYLQNRIPKLEERINELRRSWNSQNPNDKI
ncbi:MAG TPA: hypothetical protein VLA13_01360 [Massilibacterium sp.]|nr:hypothetical protein [Massilibacterium sp.]